ncbi:hypothetical protein CRENBAI_005309 [Crenichthys baileyi]|uniref:Uncharacterized protein n=1 Tax=Crenichthys baileyi TaxID=28760 RepID=A0AAV9RZ09_9TELE
MVLEFSSVLGNRQKRILSILQRKYLNIGFIPGLTRTHFPAQVKPSGPLCFAHLGPDSLYPWRPDFTLLWRFYCSRSSITF